MTIRLKKCLNPFHATDLFRYPQKTSKVFWCFQGVSKEISGIKLVNDHAIWKIFWKFFMNCWFTDKTFKISYTARKVPKYGVIYGPHFPVFGLNTEIYSVNLRIQSKYRKRRTRNNSAFGHVSRSETVMYDINSSGSGSCDISLKNRFYGNSVDPDGFKNPLIERLLPAIQENK